CRLGYLRRAGSTNRCFRRQGLNSTGCQRKSSDKDQNVATFHDASCTAWVISARVSAATSTSLPGSTRIQKTCVSNRTIMVDDVTAIFSDSGSGISSGEITSSGSAPGSEMAISAPSSSPDNSPDELRTRSWSAASKDSGTLIPSASDIDVAV